MEFLRLNGCEVWTAYAVYGQRPGRWRQDRGQGLVPSALERCELSAVQGYELVSRSDNLVVCEIDRIDEIDDRFDAREQTIALAVRQWRIIAA